MNKAIVPMNKAIQKQANTNTNEHANTNRIEKTDARIGKTDSNRKE